MTEQLKPCPFCGGAASMSSVGLDEKYGYASQVTVGCKACGINFNRCDDQNPKGGYALGGTAEPKVVALWNARTDAARIEALGGFIRDFATATFDTLPRPFIADPQDRPDDATDLAAVLAWQDDAQDLLKGAKP